MFSDPSAIYGPRVAILTSGQSFGELALINTASRAATILAQESSEMLLIMKQDYETVLQAEQARALNEKVDILRGIPALRDWPQSRLSKLSYGIITRSYPRDTAIVSEGESWRDLYIVKSGGCKVMKKFESPVKRGPGHRGGQVLPPLRRINQRAVDAVGAHELADQRPAIALQHDLRPDAVDMGGVVVEAVGRGRAAIGANRAIVPHPHIDRHRLFQRLVGQLEAGIEAGIARHGKAQQAKVDHILHVGRRQNGHARMHQRHLALMRHGGGFAAMVVARDDQHTAIRVRARDIAMFERIARPVHAWPLAVPDGEHTVAIGTRHSSRS